MSAASVCVAGSFCVSGQQNGEWGFMQKTALLFLFLFALICSACTADQAAVRERFVWPPPPDVARIEWLKSYVSQLDIEKTPSQKFWAAIAGEDAPRALLKPVEVKSVPELNKFFVSDIGRGGVVVFDLAKHESRMLELSESAPPLRIPLSIALDSNNFIYVLERRSSSILVFDPAEKYIKVISLGKISLTSPTSMAIDRNNRIYITDAASKKVFVLTLDGELVKSFGGAGEADGQFTLPVSVAFNSKGQIFVADALSSRVQIFDADGNYLRKFGQRGDTQGNFQLIKSLAIDSSDNIYVVDGRAHNVSIFNNQGELLLVLGSFYASALTGKLAPGGFSVPIGIDIDSTDKIYVVDQLNTRVQVFQYFSEDALVRKQQTGVSLQ